MSAALHTVFVAFGANLGDVRRTVTDALAVLREHGAFTEVTVSRLYRTRAVGPAQPDYLNGAFRARTALGPHEVLAVLHAVEQRFGRERRQVWGPRTLDLDLLFHDDAILATPELTLPHPRIDERGFVLAPLADLDPHWAHPVTGRSVLASWQRWLEATPDAAQCVVPLADEGAP
jgi:2-amino-4-hydroxy-6-hydroxymethyldihydropteridine diphosphokinase